MLVTHGCDLQNSLSRAELASGSGVPIEVGQGDGAAARMNRRWSRGAGLQERGRQTHCSSTLNGTRPGWKPIFFRSSALI